MPRKNKGLTVKGEKKEPKIDIKANNIHIDIEAVQAVEKTKVPLRISDKLLIMVLPENCNPEYAKDYLERKARGEKLIMEQAQYSYKNRKQKV